MHPGKTCLVQLEKLYPDVIVPTYKHEGDAGVDIQAYFSQEFKHLNRDNYGYYNGAGDAFVLRPHCRVLIPTGIKVAIHNPGYEIQVRPRSGLALKSGLTVLNTPGTIDSGYRGEIGVILYNSNSSDSCYIKHGDRIAQLVLAPVFKIEWEIVESLNKTERNEGGFGSTGVQ